MTAIWWIRRDVRLHDQPTLRAALQHGEVVPLFVLVFLLLGGSAVVMHDWTEKAQ